MALSELDENGNPITWADDSLTSTLDYDFLTNDLSITLHEYITTENVKVGQIIMLGANGADSTDDAFLAWKNKNVLVSGVF